MKPNCMNCKHFFITYDKNTPRGCRIYKIKSASLPSMVVKRANNGEECMGFSAKESKSAKKLDLNDAKNW